MKTADAALLVEVSEATIRQWKLRGYLPEEFNAADVWRCKAERMRPSEHARLDRIWLQMQHEQRR